MPNISPAWHLLDILGRKRRIPFRWILFLLLAFVTATMLAFSGGLGLMFVSVSVLGVFSLALLRAVWREARERSISLPDTGENVYGFAGWELRAFTDHDGRVWIRAGDVRSLLGLERSDAWMAQAYRDGYRRAHPEVKAWFISHDVVRRHWSGSTRIDVNRFLAWMDRELVPLQKGRETRRRAEAEAAVVCALSAAGKSRKSAFGSPVTWLAAHWHGQHRLRWYAASWLVLVFVLAVPDWSVGFGSDPVAHYQRQAIAFIAVTLLFLGGHVAWGISLWRAAQRRLAAGGSVLAGIVAGGVGLTFAFATLDHMARFDTQMGFIDVVKVALDRDGKATVRLSEDGKRLLMTGKMGRGTTLAVRDGLKQYPEVTGIELRSPGGRVTEGYALAELIRLRGLDTYVDRYCDSACTMAFVAGRERRVGLAAELGLHRSGVSWRPYEQGISNTDLNIADFYRQHGVRESMVRQIMATPFSDIHIARPAEAIEGGLATGRWEPGGA